MHVRQDGLAGVLVADKEYPPRVAFSLLGKFMRSMAEEQASAWPNVTEDTNLPINNFEADFKKYQNPAEADQIMKIQNELDAVRDIMNKNIDEVLRRGETIDSLVLKSEDLSGMSKTFFSTAKRNNQCCKMY